MKDTTARKAAGEVRGLLDQYIRYMDGVVERTDRKIEEAQRDLEQRDRQSGNRLRILERKSRGITSAHRRIAQLERDNQALRDFVSEALTALRSDNEARMEQALSNLQSQGSTVQSGSEELEGRLRTIGESAAKAHDRIDEIQKSSLYGVDLEKTRVEIDSEVEVHTPWIEALIVGIAAAVAVGLGLSWWTELSDEKIVGFAVIAFFVGFLFVSSLERFSVNLTGRLVWVRKKEEDTTTAVLPTVFEDAPDETKELDLKQEVKA